MPESRTDVVKASEFVLQFCKPGERILEVGSGDGRLARLLAEMGLEVLAVDHSPEAVTAIRRLGVDVVHSDFLDFEHEGADVLLFSRSLHHLSPLDDVIAHAFGLLRPGGRVLIDDFDLAAMDEPTATWFYGLASTLSAAGLGHGLPGKIPEDPLQFWHDDHLAEPALATRAGMTEALSRLLEPVCQTECEYLYRYHLNALDSKKRLSDVLAASFACESRLISLGQIRALGWQSVWRA